MHPAGLHLVLNWRLPHSVKALFALMVVTIASRNYIQSFNGASFPVTSSSLGLRAKLQNFFAMSLSKSFRQSTHQMPNLCCLRIFAATAVIQNLTELTWRLSSHCHIYEESTYWRFNLANRKCCARIDTVWTFTRLALLHRLRCLDFLGYEFELLTYGHAA